MTRNLLIITVVLFVGALGLSIVGLASNQPAALIPALLCLSPLFMLALGATVGRASNEFVIARKAPRNAVQQPGRTVNPRRVQETESLS